MSVEGLALDGAFKLATMVAEAIAKETGADKAVSYEVAIKVARSYVAAERRAVTDARERAKARVKGSK